MEKWNSGIMEKWNSGIMEKWKIFYIFLHEYKNYVYLQREI